MATPAVPPVITGIRILIVEDEGIIANHIASLLTKTGYQVAGIAESSEEALEKVAELNAELVLMDIRIKGEMDGIETATRIRGQFDIPVIYLTAHSDQEDHQPGQSDRRIGVSDQTDPPHEPRDCHRNGRLQTPLRP